MEEFSCIFLVAARGLDIAGVDLIVHTAPPNDYDTFVHRSGRTGRAGRNGTSVMLYSYSGEERKLSVFENALNFRFERTAPPSPVEIAKASAWYAAKKLEKVNDNAVSYFLPHVKSMISGLLTDNHVPKIADLEELSESLVDTDITYTQDQVESLIARCLAALSNKNTIESRSLQTSETGKVTIQVEAVFKNGTSPSTVRDWQK